eukprot:jgi/Botrbrau1/14167/Bobra.182_3s0105.1
MRGNCESCITTFFWFWFLGTLASSNADYFVPPSGASSPSATINVKAPACVKNMDSKNDSLALQSQTGPCGDGHLQCPVERTVGPTRVTVAEDTRSIITPAPPLGYFLEGDAGGEQSVNVVDDPKLGVAAVYFAAPPGVMNATSARAILRLRKGSPGAPASTALCTLTVEWTVVTTEGGPPQGPEAKTGTNLPPSPPGPEAVTGTSLAPAPQIAGKVGVQASAPSI